jgi:hypothetical protein
MRAVAEVVVDHSLPLKWSTDVAEHIVRTAQELNSQLTTSGSAP